MTKNKMIKRSYWKGRMRTIHISSIPKPWTGTTNYPLKSQRRKKLRTRQKSPSKNNCFCRPNRHHRLHKPSSSEILLTTLRNSEATERVEEVPINKNQTLLNRRERSTGKVRNTMVNNTRDKISIPLIKISPDILKQMEPNRGGRLVRGGESWSLPIPTPKDNTPTNTPTSISPRLKEKEKQNKDEDLRRRDQMSWGAASNALDRQSKWDQV